MNKRETGILGEQVARKYLLEKGYLLLDVNYKIPWAEIDIIAEKNDHIIFVEVKTNAYKSTVRDFNPEIRVDYRKLNKISRLAAYYLNDRGLVDKKWQIDIISVNLDLVFKKATVKHFEKVGV